MEKSKDTKTKKNKAKFSKKKIDSYIDSKLDELSWKMGEKKYNYREALHDR